MNDVAAGVCGACLMSHGVNDSQKSIGKCHSGQTLCVMHLGTGIHISVVRWNQILVDHLNGMQCQRIGIFAVKGRNVRFDRMSHSVHTCMSSQFLWHGSCQSGIYDCYIRCDVKVSQRIFDPLCIIRDNGECSYLGSGAGGRGNSAGLCLCAQGWEAEWCDQILKACFRVFIEGPHSLCSIDWRTAAYSYDPVRLEFFHSLCALHNGFYRRIRLNSLKQLNLHACFL